MLRTWLAIAIVQISALATSSAAHAEVIASCGASFGKTFYLSQDKGGWEDDKITQGSFSFVRDANGDWDVLYVDASKKINSYRSSGAKIVAVDFDAQNRTFLIVAAFPGEGVVDTYSLTADPVDKVQRILLWTTNKASKVGVGLTKISGMIAACE